MRKEATVVSFEVLSWHLLGGTEENKRKNSELLISCWDLKLVLTKTKQVFYFTFCDTKAYVWDSNQ
jgi:hypothetical protein